MILLHQVFRPFGTSSISLAISPGDSRLTQSGFDLMGWPLGRGIDNVGVGLVARSTGLAGPDSALCEEKKLSIVAF
jgi:hypothetical protein